MQRRRRINFILACWLALSSLLPTQCLGAFATQTESAAPSVVSPTVVKEEVLPACCQGGRPMTCCSTPAPNAEACGSLPTQGNQLACSCFTTPSAPDPLHTSNPLASVCLEPVRYALLPPPVGPPARFDRASAVPLPTLLLASLASRAPPFQG
jgi:hypothetical protein